MPLRHMEGGGLELRSFLNSALYGTDLSDSRPGRFISMQINPGTHWIGGLVGPGDGVHAFGEQKYPFPLLLLLLLIIIIIIIITLSRTDASWPYPVSIKVSVTDVLCSFSLPVDSSSQPAAVLCLPSLLTRCTHLLSQLPNCTKTARISSSFKMANHLKQITKLHLFAFIIQVLSCSWWFPSTQRRWESPRWWGLMGPLWRHHVWQWSRFKPILLGASHDSVRLVTCVNMHGLFERCC
jgi:hypothetical protein